MPYYDAWPVDTRELDPKMEAVRQGCFAHDAQAGACIAEVAKKDRYISTVEQGKATSIEGLTLVAGFHHGLAIVGRGSERHYRVVRTGVRTGKRAPLHCTHHMPFLHRHGPNILIIVGLVWSIFLLKMLASSDLSLRVFDELKVTEGAQTVRITRFNPLAVLVWALLLTLMVAAIAHFTSLVLRIITQSKVAAVASNADRILGGVSGLLTVLDRHAAQSATLSVALKNAPHVAGIQTVVMALMQEGQQLTNELAQLSSELSGKEMERQTVAQQLHQTIDMAVKDPLSGVHNRRAFDEALKQAVDAARQDKKPLSLVMLDLDHFKRINDSYGHQVGDDVIKMLGGVLSSSVRKTDTAARYGGEEFAVLLPGADLDTALKLAERMRKKFEARRPVVRANGRRMEAVTASFGIAELRVGEAGTDLVSRADKKLYAAKMAGRNRVMG